MNVPSIKNVKNLRGKRVLVRADFNVPIKNGQIQDDFKIIKGLATIRYLAQKGAKVVIISHLGRPTGFDAKLSLRPIAKRIAILLGKDVPVVSGNSVLSGISPRAEGDIVMLENIRFLPGEEKNDRATIQMLGALADIFVLDGFGVSHRAAASVSGVAGFLPHYAGLLLSEEIEGLNRVMEHPTKPLVVVLGGAKMETKIPVLKKLLPLADYILLGGGMVNTYLWAKGRDVGCSLVDKEFKKEALLYGGKKKVIFPVDVVVGEKNGRRAQVMPIDYKFPSYAKAPEDRQILNSKFGIYDIGPKTVKLYAEYLKKANTIVWNGAMGFFEQPPYQYGTYAVAQLIATRAKGNAFGVCGGGETVEVLKKLQILDDIDLVSTGGGAMLEFLSGKKLPGIEALRKK